MTPRPGLARRLPIPAPTALHEATDSYLRRLATLNHIQFNELKLHLGLEPHREVHALAPANLHRLAICTGYITGQLTATLPELDPPHLKSGLFTRTRHPACTRCARRHRG
ncbi:hypothetical protein [Nocardia tengchongensis]|uniref:hypothetical protein n=1 Tax=Nocardia tengchongensis TaxID=2055889 RepID=UPI003614860B